MQRILIIGASGSGKSTLARRISDRLGLPYFASDPFYWEAGWRPTAQERVLEQLRGVLKHESWVLDGNFDDQRALLWTRAECIVWLDYPLPIVLSRVIIRNLGWAISGEVIWAGNRMSLQRAVSGIRHSLRSVPGKRAVYPGYIAALKGVDVYHFRAARQTEAWLASLKPFI
jgi:hypothetical protein